MENKRLTMTVRLQVTKAQALALHAMFRHWNFLSGIGSSSHVSFFVDGDGNFHPRCEVWFDRRVPELTEVIRDASVIDPQMADDSFDFDQVAALLRCQSEPT